MKEIDKRLIGDWLIDPADIESIKLMGKVTMTFSENNILRYIVENKGTIQISNLTYWVENGFIFSLQPPSNDIEKTVYKFENDESVIITKENLKTKFHKVK